MKQLSVLLIALFAFSASTTAQNEDAISRYFEKYMDDKDFTVVYVSAKMFEILGKLNIHDLEDEEAAIILETVKDMRGLRVLTTEINAIKVYEEAVNTINTTEYEELMTVRTEDENVQFLVKESGDVIHELLLLVGEPDEFVMVSFIGNIHLDKISKLAKVLDVEGAEHLDKLEEEERREKKTEIKAY